MNYEHAIEWMEAIDEEDYDGFWMGNITDKDLNNLFGLGLVEWRHAEQGEPRENFELSDYGIKMLDAQRSFDFYGSSDYDRALAKEARS